MASWLILPTVVFPQYCNPNLDAPILMYWPIFVPFRARTQMAAWRTATSCPRRRTGPGSLSRDRPAPAGYWSADISSVTSLFEVHYLSLIWVFFSRLCCQNIDFFSIAWLESHLCFKHARPKLCHSPKVENGVDNFYFFSLIHITGFLSCHRQYCTPIGRNKGKIISWGRVHPESSSSPKITE